MPDPTRVLAVLRRAFREVSTCSVGLTGSMARGDFRVDEQGHFVSDMDLLPVVRGRADVEQARAHIRVPMEQVSAQLGIRCTAAITLESHYVRAGAAGYVRSMSTVPFFHDPLGINKFRGGQQSPYLNSLNWDLQPVGYYVAKAWVEDPATNLMKAHRALCDARQCQDDGLRQRPQKDGPRTSAEECAMDAIPAAETIIADLQKIIAETQCELLDSTRKCLDLLDVGGEGADGFRKVRDLIFLENQGLSFEDSVLVVDRPG